MLATHASRQPAPVLACGALWLRRLVRPNAFGNALGTSIAEASQSGVDWGNAPDESAAETARLGRLGTAPVADDSAVGGSGLSFNRDAVASWGRQVNTGIRVAASADASGGWTTAPSGSADSFFPTPQVVASGSDAKGLAWYQYDDGAESHAIANPVIETHALDLTPAGGGLLVSGRASMNSYWSDMQDAAVASGSPLSYLAARGMQTLGNVGYSLADMADAVYNNPEQSVAGGLKSIANFGPDAFNGATNLVKTSLNGYSMLAEKLGAGDGTFAGFRGSDAYNITPLFGYDNQAQAGGALLTQVALGAGLAKYGNYSLELNTGSAGMLSANPLPLRLVAPETASGLGLSVEVRNGYSYSLDETGRAIRIQGELTSNPAQVRNIQAQLDAGGPYRLTTDEGGHFIGRRFDGPLDDFNHFAQDVNFNRGAYKSLENSWQRALDGGQTVYVDIKPSYAGSSLRPEGLRINYSIDGQPSRVSFKNRSGG